jgi:VCBS repeat-containing protein
MIKLQNTWLALLALVALLAFASVSCGPGGGTPPPTDGDVEVHIVVDGAGRVVVGPTSHECRDDCLWTGESGVDTRIEAVPAPGYVFVAWEGVCDAFENPCTRTFEDGDTIKATFAPHALRLDLSGDGEGTFRLQGAGIDATCDGDCGVGLDAPGLQLAVIAAPSSVRTTIDEAWTGPCDPATTQAQLLPRRGHGRHHGGQDLAPPARRARRRLRHRAQRDLERQRRAGRPRERRRHPGRRPDRQPRRGRRARHRDAGSGRRLHLHPRAGLRRRPTFTYRARDAFGNDSNTATVTITVTQVNRAPVANDDGYTTPRNDTLVVDADEGVLANDTDPDGDTLTAILVDGVDHGDLTLAADGSFTYTPEDDFTGEDTFTYVASDGDRQSTPATVTIAVTQPNRPPVANDDGYSTPRNDTLVVDADEGVLANDTDPDGDTLTAILVDGVDHGVLVLADDGSFTYTPDDDFTGEDSFTYVANDGVADSNTATVTIAVTQPNRPPVANDDAYDVEYEEERIVRRNFGVLANDTDPDGDRLTAILRDDVENGELELAADGSFTYEPEDDFSGEDAFTYVASDGELESEPATVTLTVEEDDD